MKAADDKVDPSNNKSGYPTNRELYRYATHLPDICRSADSQCSITRLEERPFSRKGRSR